MKASRYLLHFPALLLAASLLSGCGHKEGDGHSHDKEEKSGEHEGHGHGEESPSGASYKAGKGVIVTEETKKLMGIEVTDVAERKVPDQIHFTLQVFGEKHHHAANSSDHLGCDVHGSGMLATNIAAAVKAGQPVEILKDTNSPLRGVVLTVQKAMALGESEVVIGVSNAVAILKAGDFIPARITLPRNEVVAAVPESALLTTTEGTFVYAVNGDAYFRTAVKVGAQAEGWVEIADGLLTGDQVVTKPVQTLWLIELRATKGGGHSH